MAVNPSVRGDDPESADAAPTLDVTPREPSTAGTAGRRGRTAWAVAGLVIILAGLGVVLFNGLRDASTFFYNVDEAKAMQGQLQGRRFRMQGNVVDGTVAQTARGVTFVLTYNGQQVKVDHTGDPPDLFGPKIPVVLEGTFVGNRFTSDRILIRHDSTYVEKNKSRLRQAERDVQKVTADGTVPGPALTGSPG